MAESVEPRTHDPVPGSFASGLYRHFERFHRTKGFPERLFVRLHMANGAEFFCRGLWIGHVDDVPGCVLSHGTPAHSDEALVIREDHIISARFSLRPPEDDRADSYPFGFAAGVASTN